MNVSSSLASSRPLVRVERHVTRGHPEAKFLMLVACVVDCAVSGSVFDQEVEDRDDSGDLGDDALVIVRAMDEVQKRGYRCLRAPIHSSQSGTFQKHPKKASAAGDTSKMH